jgi:hypothetical protein
VGHVAVWWPSHGGPHTVALTKVDVLQRDGVDYAAVCHTVASTKVRVLPRGDGAQVSRAAVCHTVALSMVKVEIGVEILLW